ncbi:MAG TPA: hypothetical protein DDW52_26145 [Planctomycetaceae bacterium]|nr:hypothetical protein [Planctomycetaceae bacterium]
MRDSAAYANRLCRFEELRSIITTLDQFVAHLENNGLAVDELRKRDAFATHKNWAAVFGQFDNRTRHRQGSQLWMNSSRYLADNFSSYSFLVV